MRRCLSNASFFVTLVNKLARFLISKKNIIRSDSLYFMRPKPKDQYYQEFLSE